MSFDLYVWYEPWPITADEAHAKIDGGGFTAHPAIPRVRDALLSRFPAGDEETSAWSVPPGPSDTLLVLACAWSRHTEVAAACRAEAAAAGLVCYASADHVVDPNAADHIPPITLTVADGPAVPDPDAARVERAVRRLGGNDYFAILEREEIQFAQIGYGESAGASPGVYALEYREGPLFRTETRDVTEAVRFFQEYLAGDDTWKRRHLWKQIAE